MISGSRTVAEAMCPHICKVKICSLWNIKKVQIEKKNLQDMALEWIQWCENGYEPDDTEYIGL